jgi:hypothetical protein
VLADGVYDVIVVDADDEGEEPDRAVRLDVTILAGAHKGEVVSVRATGLGVDALDCLGTPGTLTVSGGAPTIHLER